MCGPASPACGSNPTSIDEALLEIGQLCREQIGDWRRGTLTAACIDSAGPSQSGQPTDAGRRSAGRHSGPQRPGLGRQFRPAGADQLPSLPEFGRDRPGPGPSDSAGKQNRTFVVILVADRADPGRTGKAVRRRRTRPADPRAIGGDRPRRGDGTGRTARRSRSDAVLDSAAGLTRYEAENAFALSLVRHRRIEPAVIFEQKSQMLKKSGLLSLHRGQRNVRGPGRPGVAQGILPALAPASATALRSSPSPRRVAALAAGLRQVGIRKESRQRNGPADAWCSTWAACWARWSASRSKTSAKRCGSPTRWRRAFCSATKWKRRSAACNGQGDSGVSSRLFGTLSTWLNDHESDVYFVGTSNDISRLPPEFARAERFDGVFMIDLPGPQGAADDLADVPAQVRSRRRSAAPGRHRLDRRRDPLLLPTGGPARCSAHGSGQNVVPVAITAGESVEKLRNLGGRALPVGRQAGRLLPRLDRNPKAWPASKPRSVQQLMRRTGDFIEQLCSLARIVLGFQIGLLERSIVAGRWCHGGPGACERFD